jgi:glycosyltransferase involved in cell wall biosynthesis
VTGSVAFAVPGDLATPTGGYAYDRRIIAELRQLGWCVGVLELGDEFPDASPTVRAQALARLDAMSAEQTIVVDGLALGALPEIRTIRRDRVLIGLIHHPLALESGLAPAVAAARRESERAALSAVHHVVATSRTTARILSADYEVPSSRISVVVPGTDPVPPARGSGGAQVAVLAVGAVTFRKGHDLLVAALAEAGDLPWRLDIVGDLTRDPAQAARLGADIHRLGLEGRIRLLGAVPGERLAALYDGADLFVLPSRFEGYGMAFTEAVAYGLPIIGTTAGAIPEAVGAGVLVPPDDRPALAAALRTLIADGVARARLAARSRAAAAELPRWSISAQAFARAIEVAGFQAGCPAL